MCPQVMKTYHMYHAESISAESKLKEAEKQEEKQFNKSGDLSMNLLRHEDRPQRRSSVKKIEKMKEKASGGPGDWDGAGRGGVKLPSAWASHSAPRVSGGGLMLSAAAPLGGQCHGGGRAGHASARTC